MELACHHYIFASIPLAIGGKPCQKILQSLKEELEIDVGFKKWEWNGICCFYGISSHTIL